MYGGEREGGRGVDKGNGEEGRKCADGCEPLGGVFETIVSVAVLEPKR